MTGACASSCSHVGSSTLELDCSFESICETCTYFQPTIQFRPVLARQRDDATTKGQTGRQHLFDDLLNRLDESHAS
jgi:hypothetical protein